ncbi:MAG TPA: superoxide dismutase family protein [Candidatus Saccharimonadales bacterium]|nr:superoxide dismutase family protein [Candidatus Saccharimonadales bacterium]
MEVSGPGKKETARAEAIVSGEGISGQAELVEYQIGTQTLVQIKLELSGNPTKLKPGLHAVHIHEKADCSGGFKCAGGHFDPGPAGNSDPDANHPFHAGDLPNIVINEEGQGRLEALTTRVTISPGPASIIGGEGTALMIHANPDPYHGGESGSGVSGGPRIACGIIELKPVG